MSMAKIRRGRKDSGPSPLVLALSFALFALCTVFTGPDAQAKGDPNWDDVLKNGRQQLAIGETDKAIELFQKAVKKYPQSSQCHTELGKALKRRGKLSEAKAEFKCATELNNTYAAAFYELGCVCESDQEWDAAAEAFTHYADLCPDAAQRKTIEDRIRTCKGHKE